MKLERIKLSELHGNKYDVVIIGAGINGCSATKSLSTQGYHVLLLDKADFASGSSSRSSGLLHCGLRYLEPNPTIWEFLKRPYKLLNGLKMARQAMKDRSEFVSSKPEQVTRFQFFFPVYQDVHFKKWHIDLALRILDFIGGNKDVPLGHMNIPVSEVTKHPLLKNLRDHPNLAGVASFDEYRFDWPERIALDMALDACDLGATIRNYTHVERLASQSNDLWQCHLRDTLTDEVGTVTSHIVLNTAGIWMDDLFSAGGQTVKPLINGTKGTHIAFKLSPELAGFGIVTLNRIRLPFYAIPWRGMHYFGPTETPYNGSKDDIIPTEDEITFLLDEANFLLPGLGLKRSDVIFSWAGVRPLGADVNFPEGKRVREIHDLKDQGMPNVFAMTAGPIMTHRSAGQALLKKVRSCLKPSRNAIKLRHRSRSYPENKNSPPLLGGFSKIKHSDVAYAVRHEMPESLTDIMFRRIGAGWTPTHGVEAIETVASIAGDYLEWNDQRRKQEIDDYINILKRTYGWSGTKT